jgi:hypothetical protein
MCLFHFSTCFEHSSTHHQENQLYQYIIWYTPPTQSDILGVPGGKVNILGGYSISHSKQKTLNEHVSYSERFPR